MDGDDAETRIKQHIEMLVQAGMRSIAVEGSNATFLNETCVNANRQALSPGGRDDVISPK